jgi:hypothetical protein
MGEQEEFDMSDLLLLVMSMVSVVPFVHAAYGAYRVSRGDGYRHPIAADLVERG